MAIEFNRRLFLKTAIGLGSSLLLSPADGAVPFRFHQHSSNDLSELLLDLVNGERSSGGLSRLALDDLASTVAHRHASEMVSGGYVSHWGQDGLKPYHRYSFAGGYDAVAENISAASSLESVDAEFIRMTLTQSHLRMLSEKPPNDGHRRTILGSQYTHVGFGTSLMERELRLVELFVARYVWLAPFETRGQRNDLIPFRGRVLNPDHTFQYVEVFFEQKPSPPEIGWLRTPRSYGLPDDFDTLKPALSRGIRYSDGTKGAVKVDEGGQFQFSVRLNRKEAGIYTVVVWIANRKSSMKFQATNACIQVE